MKKQTISFLYFFIFLNSFFAQKSEKIDTLESNKAKNYHYKAYTLRKEQKKDSAYYFYKKANEIFVNIKDSLLIGDTFVNMAILQSDVGDYIGSDQTAVEALKYFKKDKIVYLTSIYNCLAISSRGQKDYKEAIYWYNKAIKIAKNNANKIIYLQNKANAYRDLNQFEESIAILDSLSKVELNPVKTKARVIDNLAYTKWLNGDRENVLEGLKEALEIRLKENDTRGLLASYQHLSDYYSQKNIKLSTQYAKKKYQLAIKRKSPQDQLEALARLIDLDNSSNIKTYYTYYIRINDSLNKAEQQAKNKFAKLKYDSDKNREDNYKLNIKNAEKELELQKEKTNSIIGASLSGFIILLILIFIYYRNQKHKQEKRAEVYKTETRIAKKIHDEVANNVVNIMNKVQYTEEGKEILLDDLEEVYLLTRNISHQNNQIETGKLFVDSLKLLITSFNNSTTTIIIKSIEKVALDKLSESKQIEIYRVIQELLVNMQKHSEAKLVAISFNKNKKDYSIRYSDNGVGVALDEFSKKNGLSNVESRIESINGSITFESSKNNGFKALINFKE